jgi:hypothetical protein
VELRKREDALRACLSSDDRDRNCSKESDGVHEAQEALEKVRRLNSRLEQVIGEYQPQANRLQQLLNSKTSKAKGDLQRSIDKYQQYLNQAKPGSSTSQSTSSKQRLASFGNEFQGNVGEGIAERICAEKLGLTPDPRFDKSEYGHGIDTIYLDEEGRLVIVEAKLDKRGIRALRDDPATQKLVGISWIMV